MKKNLSVLLAFLFIISLNSNAFGGDGNSRKSTKAGTADRLTAGNSNDDVDELNKKRRKKRKKGKKGKKGRYVAFKQGNVIISAGYGYPNLTKSLYKMYETYPDYSVTGMGPIHGKVEYAINDKFGIGLSMNMVSTEMTWLEEGWDQNLDPVFYKAGYEYNATAFNIRGNYHFYVEEKLDAYAGMGIGYNSAKSKYFTDDPNGLPESITLPLPLGLELGAGIRYYLTPNIGLYAEIGAFKSVLQGGIVIKF